MTTQQEAYEAAESTWRFEKRISLPLLIMILSGIIAGAFAFWQVRAQAAENAEKIEKLEEVPAEIASIRQEIKQLRETQAEMKENDEMQLDVMLQIQLAIARLEERLNRQ